MSIIRGSKVPSPYGLPALTIHGVLEHLVKDSESASQKTAVIYEGKKTTFDVFNRQANALARVIKDRLKISNQGDHGPVCIGLHLDPSDTVLKLVFAVLKLGAAYLPLDPAYPFKHLRYTISNSTPCCVVTANTCSTGQVTEMISNLCETEKPVILLLSDLLASMTYFQDDDLNLSDRLTDSRVNSSSLACTLYTSGSTGVPKGVLFPHRAILHRASALWNIFPMTESDISCWKFSLCFADCLTEIFGSLLRGLAVVVAPANSQNPEKVIDIFNDNQVTWTILVPTQLHNMLTVLKKQPDKEMLRSVKMLFCGGEDMSPHLAETCLSLLPNSQLVNVWGMTETTGDVTVYNVEQTDCQTPREAQISIGQPLQNTNIYLLDDNMIPVPIGEIGICYVSGPNIVDGYLVPEKLENTPHGTKQKDKFKPNPFETDPDHQILYNSGDYMRLVRDKTTNKLQLMFEGRRDTLVKYHGFRIDLSEIESAMSDIPYFERVVVRCHVQHEEKHLVAYYKVGDNPDCTSESITKYLRSVLPDYMIPSVVCVDDFPTLPNCKYTP
ncbi:beta-alanyl-bioamine nonribosomal peptide synthetase ebony-like [Glandiceps talaboti]